MRKKGKIEKIHHEPIRVKKSSEHYPPVEEWDEAPSHYRKMMLNDGESTIIVKGGLGIYRVVKLKNVVRYFPYLDRVPFEGNFRKVSPDELIRRAKEEEKFL